MQDKSQLMGLMARTSRLYKMEFNTALTDRNIDLSSEMCGLLVLLWDEDGKSQQELAETLKKDKGGITRILKSLKQRQLIASIKDPEDLRVNKIKLTQKGRKSQQPVESIIKKLRSRALQNISDKDKDRSSNVLLKIIENLETSL